MNAVFEFLANPYTQAITWFLSISICIYLAYEVKKLSFGKDAGTKAWSLIALGLFLIGLRVSFKVIFKDYDISYILQVLRYSIGIVGIIVLFNGFMALKSNIKEIYGVD